MDIHIKRCDKCKKTVQTEVHYCTGCIKHFHPGCIAFHKMYNEKKQLVPCTAKIEITSVDREVKKSNKQKRVHGQGEEERGREDDKNEMEDQDNEEKERNVEELIRMEWKKMRRDIIEEMMGSRLKDVIKEIIEVEVAKCTKMLREELRILKKELIKTKQENEQNKTEIEGKKENKEGEQKERQKVMYSQIAKKSRKEEIIVLPVKEQTSDLTAGTIKRNINIMELGVGVENVVKGSKGKIILECQKKEDRVLLAGALKENLGEHYKVYTPNKKLPKIKVIGVEEEVGREEEAEFIEKVKNQNELEIDREMFMMKIIKKSRTNEDETTIIMEVDPKTHKYFVERQRIKVGWKNCPVYDYVSVKRCFKCWGYNHVAKDCRNEKRCRRCSGDHDVLECSAKYKKCINCSRMIEKFKIEGISDNHEATDKKCETYLRMVNRNRKSIQYGEE